MATINGTDKMMSTPSSSMRGSALSSSASREKDILALVWVVIALNALMLVATGYLIWRSVTPPTLPGALPPGVVSGTTPAPGTATPQTAPQVRSFFGKITAVDGNKLTIQEVIAPTAEGQKGTNGKVRTVTLTDATVYTFQKPNPDAPTGSAPWTPTEGKKADVKKDTVALFTLNEDITSEQLSAARIDYSDAFPFAY